MELWLIFVYGLIGGAAPEVIRVYKILTEAKDFYYPKKLLVVTFLLAIIGGAIAVAFEAPNPHSAILIGFATPTIVSKYAGRPPGE